MASSSMAPTIVPGEAVDVDQAAYSAMSPQRWDVVVFRPPDSKDSNSLWAMRVIGTPGDVVSFKSGGITLNGLPAQAEAVPPNVVFLSLDQLPQNQITSSAITSPYTVPSDHYFVLGDNSAKANDSRFWGAVSRSNIVGKVRRK